MKSDYLKYWRVIRYFIKTKYNINQAELDTLLFLRSEGYFNRDKFKEFDKLVSWDKKRFDKLLRDGWIVIFRERKQNRKTIYELSYKSKRMIDSIYKKLDGEEIPTTASENNVMFLKNVSYMDERYKKMVYSMNEYVREKRKAEN